MSTIVKMDNLLDPVVRLHRLSSSTLNRYKQSSNTCADITNHGHLRPRRCKAKQQPVEDESGVTKLMSRTKVCKKKSTSKSRDVKLKQCNGKRQTRNRVDLKTNAKKSGNISGANQTAKTKALQVMFRRNKTETYHFSCKMCQYKSKEKQALDIHIKRCHTSQKLWHGLSASYPPLKSPLVKPKIQHTKIAVKETKSQANNTSKQKFQRNRTRKLSGNTFTVQLKCYLCKAVCENRTALIMHVKLHKTPEANGDISNTIIESPTQTQSTEKVLKSEEVIVPCAKEENNISDGDSNIRQPEVSAHKGNEMERQLYECQICHKRFARVKFLRYHINFVHRTKKKQSLSSQSKTKSAKSTRPKNKNEINNNIFSCDLCPYSSIKRPNVTRHKKCVHEGQKLPDRKVVNIQRCHLCSYFSSNQSNFDRHLRLRHQLGEVLQCNECPFTTFYTATLNNHAQKIHGGRGFVMAPKECKKCHTEFSSQYEMKCHLWNHLRNNTSCDANASVASKEDTNTENVKDSTSIDSVACKNKILFKCEYCEKQFARKSYLQDHVDYNHRTNGNDNLQSSEEHNPQNSQYKAGNSLVNNLHVRQEISKLSQLVKPRPGSHVEKGEHGKDCLRCKFCLTACVNAKALLSHLKRHVTPWGRP